LRLGQLQLQLKPQMQMRRVGLGNSSNSERRAASFSEPGTQPDTMMTLTLSLSI
jgi:hypothetical protein